MAAKLVGAGKIIAIDLRDDRLKLALELGATHTINPSKELIPNAIKAITGNGVDFTLETTALMPILRQAIDVLALRGTCGFVGGAPEDSELTFVTSHVMNGGRTIRGIILGDNQPRRVSSQADRAPWAGALSARKARHLLSLQEHQSGH
jgi:aryl-alcohol dehydrogenase